MSDIKEKAIALISSTASCDLDAANGTEKSLYTVPAGKTLVVTKVILHTFSADALAAVLTFGKTGGTCDEYLGDQTLTGITASYATQALRLTVVPNATPVVQSLFTAAQVFAMEITTKAGSACTCTIDVYGYIF